MKGVVMPLVTSSKILQDAYKYHYAVGAFNAHNLETAHAVIDAAEDEKAPVIVQVSMGTLRYAGTEEAASIVRTKAEQASVPVVLHLDHGKDIGVCVRCLRAGFTSLMFDGTDLHLNRYIQESGESTPDFATIYEKVQSKNAFEENVVATTRVAELSHACGIPVEAELGKIPRLAELKASIEIPDDSAEIPALFKARIHKLYAQAELVEEFIRRTGCDSLAVACGSIHGMRGAVQPLDLAHLEKLSSKAGIPLVLHGSSGVVRSAEEARVHGIPLAKNEGGIKEAIGYGVSKVNVSTVLQATFLSVLREALADNPRETDMRKLFPLATKALRDRVRFFIQLFGSSGKAG